MSKGFIIFDIIVMITLTSIISLLTISSKRIDNFYNDVKLEYEASERIRVERYHQIERCEECQIKDIF